MSGNSLLRIAARTVVSWWRMTILGAALLVVAGSPSTYRRTGVAALSRHIYDGTWKVLPWFTLLSALISLVLIRIVLVTAVSYGLSQYALEMVVRVLVLELIPLAAAMFVALRAGLSFNAGAELPAARRIDAALMGSELVPKVLASAFSVVNLALLSSVIVLVLAYVNVYGMSPWGLTAYTRTVGRVFDPAVSIGFALKTVLFGMAVAVIPTASLLAARGDDFELFSTVQPGAIRLLCVLILIEAGSLAVKYL
jgi:phospholipid/cholesterol/gamma-HCH transport system permease protein